MRNIKNIFQINSKVIVITGAAGLLGRKHAEVIAAYGGSPILIDLPNSNVEDITIALNEKYNTNAMSFFGDITHENEIESISSKVFDEYGRIDGLVNNAANNPKIESQSKKNFSRLENFTIDQWNKDISVGLTGAFLCSKHFGYRISLNEMGGSIVNISSDLGIIAPDQRLYQNDWEENDQQNVKPVSYSVVKSGIIGLTKYLSTYWPNQNVRCNAICPGGVLNGQDQIFIEKISSRIPLNRLAKPDEYQGTLLWMLSDASSYLNGAIVSVDGGRTAW